MKKTLIASLLALTTLSSANADTILGLYVGAQAWNMEAEGGFAQNDSLSNFNFDEETNASFYAALEHPIPLIPNIKVARTSFDTAGLATLDATFTFGDEVFGVDSRLSTDTELSTTDYILYYEILDNDLVSIDIGINGKQIDGDFMVVDLDSNEMSSESFNGILPMAYSRVAVGLPFTGLAIYAEGSYLAIDDNNASDIQAAITYNFVESLAIDMTIQAGYRSTSIEIEDFEDIFADLEFKGVFVGLEFHF